MELAIALLPLVMRRIEPLAERLHLIRRFLRSIGGSDVLAHRSREPSARLLVLRSGSDLEVPRPEGTTIHKLAELCRLNERCREDLRQSLHEAT